MRCDVVVVGAGPAGLNAALVLGRARRSVALCDAGEQRNAAATEMHGFLSRDGYSPKVLDRVAHEQLRRYDSVEVIDGAVLAIATDGSGDFVATLQGGRRVRARRVLLATGMRDELPPIEGLKERWGRSVFVCPHCDGWEFRDRRIGVFGIGDGVVGLAQELFRWSRDIRIFGVAPDRLASTERRWLDRRDVWYTPAAPASLEGEDGKLAAIVGNDGDRIECDVLFLSVPLVQRSGLCGALGCVMDDTGAVAIDRRHQTSVRGVFACGDMVTNIHQAIVAASSGVQAAIAIDSELLDEDLEL